MNIKSFMISMLASFSIGIVYADPIEGQVQIAGNGQPAVTGVGATGEAQSATMDQNGRWQAPERPLINNSTTPGSTLSPTMPYGAPTTDCKKRNNS